jgi:hypothetical protein
MPDMIDLGSLLSGGEMPERPKRLVDVSGLPQPTRAWVFLSNGIQLDADVRYRGNIGTDRGYRIIAELDWDTANVIRIEVDRWPPDVQFTLWVPDTMSDERAREIGNGVQWAVAGNRYKPSRFEKLT